MIYAGRGFLPRWRWPLSIFETVASAAALDTGSIIEVALDGLLIKAYGNALNSLTLPSLDFYCGCSSKAPGVLPVPLASETLAVRDCP